jgi:hypothetical protein
MKIFSNFIPESDPIYNTLKQISKPITFFYDYIPQNIEQLQINPYNFIMLHEPNEFFGMHSWVINNSHLFTGILTYNEKLLDYCNNAVLFHHSSNFLDNDYIDSFENTNKKFEISFLSGAKKLVEGHKLRQEIYKIGDQINIPKKWYYVLDDFNWDDFNKGGVGRPSHIEYIDGKMILPQVEGKKILFKESMFHICVENTKYDFYFSEKISEAFLTKTLPIYWGCPKISEYGYDERGIIRFGNVEELIYIVNNLTEEKYNELKLYIDYNYNIAKQEIRFKEKLELFFNEFIQTNNI